ncbi:MAG: ABC transporter substrate-binding protein [Gemmatimonas sp.]|nr:ABC transporter substrate-binding protein [Gemmatimonas sp.]
MLRIVSLLGSATEIVFELGLGESLVGISHECDYPPQATSLPRVSRPRFDPSGLDSGEIDAAVRHSMLEHGSVYEVDTRLLESLRPDLVLTQAVCEVCAVPTGSVEAAVAELSRSVEVASLDSHTLDGIFFTIEQVAEAGDVPNRGIETVSCLRERLWTVARAVVSEAIPGVLLLEWLDPPFAPGHWVPEMVDRAGGRNLIGRVGLRSAETDWGLLAPMDPDVLLIEPCGFDLDRAHLDAERMRTRLENVAYRAMRERRAWLLDSAWFSRSGPRVVAGIETLARLLHPHRFPESADPAVARAWR